MLAASFSAGPSLPDGCLMDGMVSPVFSKDSGVPLLLPGFMTLSNPGAKKAQDHYGGDQTLMKKSITFKCQNHKFFCFQKRGRPEEAPEMKAGLQRMRSVIRVKRERGGAGGAGGKQQGGNLQSCNNVT